MRRGIAVLVVGFVLSACSGGDDAERASAPGAERRRTSVSTTTSPPDDQAPSTTVVAPPTTARPGGTGGGGGAATVALRRLTSCTQLLDGIRAQALRYVGPFGLPGSGGMGGGDVALRAEPAAEGAAAGSASGGDSASSAPPAPGVDYSTTNVQEEGVDEPDLVKTDGRRILTVARGRLQVLVTENGTPRLVGSVGLPASGDHQLLLAGDRAIVLSRSYAVAQPVRDSSSASPTYYPPTSRAAVTIVDVSRPSEPRTLHTVEVDGDLVAGRMVDGVVRLVMHTYPTALAFSYPRDGSTAERDRALAHNRDVVSRSQLSSWVPRFDRVDVASSQPRTTSGIAVSCDRSYEPAQFAGFGTLSVVTLDPADPTPRQGTSVMADAGTVYASRSNLFVATHRWGDPVAVDGGGSTSPMIPPSPSPLTHLHQFDISDAAGARYLASGSVRGTVLNQFSMSEHEGVLRVATTDGSNGGESFVTTLSRSGSVLGMMGQVGGLGRGERIYATRFIGDLGYVVTFRQTDPLYVVDLRNPRAPRVAGELKIPGYSAYLHPISESLLIGIGQDATEEGRRTGVQVSLFDVSDPSRPVRLHQKAMGASGTEAEYDHHAFLWWPATKLAVIPLQSYGTDGSSFAGAVGLRIDRSGITEIGRISHPTSSSPPPSGSGAPDRAGYGGPVRRSLVADGVLDTISDGGLLASDLGTLRSRTWVPFGG